MLEKQELKFMIQDKELKNEKLTEEKFCIPFKGLTVYDMNENITTLFYILKKIQESINPVPVTESFYRDIEKMIEERKCFNVSYLYTILV